MMVNNKKGVIMDTKTILSKIKKYKEIHPQYEIDEIGIFGSFARGEANDSSDIDVYVKLQKSNLFLLSKIRIELEEVLGKSVDLVQVRDRMNSYLKNHIQKESISA